MMTVYLLMSVGMIKDPSLSRQVHCDALLLLASVCQGNKDNRIQFGRQDGVLTLLPFFKYVYYST